jgi:hypothetical protein
MHSPTPGHRAALKIWLSMVAALALTCCAVQQAPRTTLETVAFNYATIESLSNTVAWRVRRGEITPAKAANIKQVLEEALRINGAAETAYRNNQSDDAAGYLRLASEMIAQLEDML